MVDVSVDHSENRSTNIFERKNIVMKTVKNLLVVCAFILLATISLYGGEYTLAPTYPDVSEWGGHGIVKYTHTFVAATDTCYMPFSVPRARAGTDTVVVSVSGGSAPYLQSGTTDTVKVYFGYQWSDNNTNWSTISALGTDSTKTGTEGVYTWVFNRITTFTPAGIHPYYRIVAIGQTTSGGATNIIGNKIMVFTLRPYDY